MGHIAVVGNDGSSDDVYYIPELLKLTGLPVDDSIQDADLVIVLLRKDQTSLPLVEHQNIQVMVMDKVVEIPDSLRQYPAIYFEEKEGPKQFFGFIRRLRQERGIKPTLRENAHYEDWLRRDWLQKGQILSYRFHYLPEWMLVLKILATDVVQSVFAWSDGYPLILVDVKPVGIWGMIRSVFQNHQTFFSNNDPPAELAGGILFFTGKVAIVLPGGFVTRRLIRFIDAKAPEEDRIIFEYLQLFASQKEAVAWLMSVDKL